jgi:CRP-like cAMP-binding protein
MDTKTMERIRTLFLFRDVREELLAEMLSDPRAEAAGFAAGEIIYDESNYRKSLGIVLSGRAEVQAVGAGHTVVLNRLDSPCLFGAAGLFQEEDGYVTRIIALSDAKILFIPQDLLTDFMRRDFKLAENYLAFLSQRIRFLNRKISGFTQSGAEAKLARYLLDIASGQGGDIVRLPASIKHISSVLNLGRASLYRALLALSDFGYISREGKTIRLLSPPGLKSLCQ